MTSILYQGLDFMTELMLYLELHITTKFKVLIRIRDIFKDTY